MAGIIQPEQLSSNVLSTQATPTGGAAFSAKQRLLSDLLDPVSPQDAATRAWVLAQMDYSNAIITKSVGFVTSLKVPGSAGKRCVDIHYELTGDLDVGLFLQIHDIAAAVPGVGDEALECIPVTALDADTWEPPGTWLFTNGIFVGLSDTIRTWTPSSLAYLYTVVRNLP